MSHAHAVVYRLEDGTMREMYLPPGAAIVQVPAGFLIMHEDAEVDRIVSVRPLLPPKREEEADAPEGDGERQGNDPAGVDEYGRDE